MAFKILIRWTIAVAIILSSVIFYRFNVNPLSETQYAIIRVLVYLSIIPTIYFSQSVKAMIEESPKSLKWTKIENPVDNIIDIQTPSGIRNYNFRFATSYKTGFYRWRVYTFRNETFRIFHDTLLNNYYHVD